MKSFLKGFFGLALCVILLNTNAAFAASYACVNDTSQINTYLNQGQVVTQRSSYSSCSGNIRLKFAYPSTNYSTKVCYPSAPDNFPEGYVAVQSDNYSNCNVGSIRRGYEIKRPSTGSSGQQICNFSGTKIPPGFIVYQKDISTSQCDPSSSASTTDAIKIKIPSSSPGTHSWDCQTPIHSLPEGFVITKYDKISSCRTSTTSTGLALRVTVPKTNVNTTVCQNSPIPAGFAYFASGSYSGCGTTGTGSGPGFKIGPVSGNTATICGRESDDIPPGYVVNSISDYGDCEGSYQSWSLKKPSTSGTTSACTIGGEYLMPSGFVITKRNNNSSCDGNPGYIVKKPSGSSQFICQATPTIPDGWAVQSTGTHTNCSASGSGPSAIIVPTTGDGPYSICANTPIPSGFVINKEVNLWNCTNSRGWTVLRPSEVRGAETVVCSSFNEANIPSGYVITERDNYSQCPRIGQGYKVSKPVLSGDTVTCLGSSLPDGFAVTAEDSYSQCGLGSNSGPGSTISAISGNGPFYLCAGSSIPDGYVVTGNEETISSCGGGYGVEIKLADPTMSMAICEGSPIPDDFIVYEFDNNTKCGFDRGLKIKVPTQSGSTFVCDQFTVIPDGYVKIPGSDDDSTSCSYSGVGASYMITLSSNQVIPTPFVNVEADVSSKPVDPVVSCPTHPVSSGLIGNAAKNQDGCN